MRCARSGSLADLCRSFALGRLIVAIVVFGIEVAVHSVHHLDEPAPVSICAVFAASLDTEGACPVAAVLVAPTWQVRAELPVEDASSRQPSTAWTCASRAPPTRPVA